jgi:hypothetical protein
MSRHGKRRDARGRGGRARWALLAGAIIVATAGGTLWLRSAPKEANAGTPRLVVDAAEVDLGYRRFDTPVRVVFTLANTGDAPLRLTEQPPVRVIAGC